MKTLPERVRNPLSNSELERRWSAVREAMRDAGIEALVVGGSSGAAGGYFRWFTGQPTEGWTPRSVIFPREGLMTMVEHGPIGGEAKLEGTDPAYPGVGQLFTTPSHLFSVSYTGSQDADLVARQIRKGGYKTLGLVGAVGMYHGFCASLEERLSELQVVDATEAVDRLKCSKSGEEIDLIRHTAAMQDEIIEKLKSHIRPGLRDFEVAAHAEHIGRLLGSEDGIFLGSSAPAGTASVFVPGPLQGRELREGDTLTLLIENNGPGGFYTEIARTFVLGKASQEQVDSLGLVIEAQRNLLKHLRPGRPCREVWEAHNAFMRGRGLPEERRLTCHGQGYDLVERPLMRFDETMTVPENINIACHPGFGNQRVFAVICDNYLIGPEGPGECLHRTPQQIIEL